MNSIAPNPGLRWLLAEVTFKCPLQCPYCSNPLEFAKNRNELSTDDWKRIMDEARSLGAVQIGFSGGEPLVRKDLEELVAHARGLGFYTNLLTSGIGMDEARVGNLKEAGLDHIQISFQASDALLNNFIGGTDTFEHKLAMAKAVKKAGYPMVLNFVLYRDNIDRIADIIDMALELSADQVELANTQYYGWAWHNRERLMPSKAQLERAEKIAKEYQDKYYSKCKIFYVVPDYYEGLPKPCVSGWGNLFINVAPDGTVLPCHGCRDIPGLTFPNAKDETLESIWFDSDLFNRYRGDEWMKEPCRSCPKKDKDFGGCRCQALLVTGDASNTDPACSLSPHHGKIKDAVAKAQVSDEEALARPIVFRNARNSKQFFHR